MDNLKIVGISFHTAGKIFDFDSRDLELQAGDQVIVETERGRALGVVVREIRQIQPEEAPPKLKTVLRKAAESDLAMAETNTQRETEALHYCQQRVAERKMEMKLVRAEYLFDGSKIIFFFTADGRIDFRDLVRDLAQHFRTRIEMRQIGVRDEAKLVGGIGVCGRELCCCTYLRNFAPVSVKMAKTQGLALNPTKISGQCGRLLCCLAYEYETYNELRKNLPKCGKRIPYGTGTAEVISIDVLAQKMTLCCENGERCEVKAEEMKKGLDNLLKEKTQSADQPPGEQAEKKTESGPELGSDQTDRRGSRRPASRSRRVADEVKERPKQTPPSREQKDQKPATDGQEADPNRPRRRSRRRSHRRSNKPKSPETS
jgi:cell fate regulator YaaT (PSP1 superfamily)